MSNLSSLNSSTLGAYFPEITLPDGTKVQTGTVGALLANIRTYDSLAETEVERRAGLEEAFRTALPLLFKVGMFDLFTPEEWVGVDTEGKKVSPGRRRVGELAGEWVREREGRKEAN